MKQLNYALRRSARPSRQPAFLSRRPRSVAFLQIAESGQADAAFHAVCHFLGIVLEPLERADLALEDLFFSAHDLHFSVAADYSILNAAAGNGPTLGIRKMLSTSARPR